MGLRTTRLTDQLAVAAEAVAHGSTHTGHWETLAAFATRDGVDRIAELLASHAPRTGPTHDWWRYTILLSMELTPEEALRATRALIDIEEAGGGPRFDVDRHALRVSATMKWLSEHLSRLHAGTATSLEQSAAAMVVNASRVARARLGR